MGTFKNDPALATNQLKIERVVTVPVTVHYADLEDLEAAITAAPDNVHAEVKRVTASSESADVIITRTGPGVNESSILRLLELSGVRHSVGRIKSRKASDAPDAGEE